MGKQVVSVRGLHQGTGTAVFIIALVPGPAFAVQPGESAIVTFGPGVTPLVRTGFEARLLPVSAGLGGLGYLGGAKASVFLNDRFYLGVAGFGGAKGSRADPSTEVSSLGGAFLGCEAVRIPGLVGLDLSLLVGAGANGAAGSVAIEPAVAVETAPLLGTGLRLRLGGTYSYLPMASGAGGLGATIGIEFKGHVAAAAVELAPSSRDTFTDPLAIDEDEEQE